MFQDLIARVGQQPNVAWRGRFADACIELRSDGESHYLHLDGDGVRLGAKQPGRDATLCLDASDRR